MAKTAVAQNDDFDIRARLLDLDFFLLTISLVLFGNAVLELAGYKFL